MKVLVTGSREWGDEKAILKALLAVDNGSRMVLVHGGARGADAIADRVAKELGWEVRVYRAQWSKHGNAAGPIRNQEMLDKEHVPSEPIDICLAFPLPHSTGTRDMMQRCMTAGVRLIINSERVVHVKLADPQ